MKIILLLMVGLLFLRWVARKIERRILFLPSRDSQYPLENLRRHHGVAFEAHFVAGEDDILIHLLFQFGFERFALVR